MDADKLNGLGQDSMRSLKLKELIDNLHGWITYSMTFY